MRVLIDLSHPAHAHFFRHPIAILRSQGHEVLITSRKKDVTLLLLEKMGLKHYPLSSASYGKIGLLTELFKRNFSLGRICRSFRPDVMAAIGGIFIAQVGALMRIPSLVFYDTENAKLQNMVTYPFASLVVVPRCYEGPVPKHTIRYPGYHELSYLHPNRFSARREIALANGLDACRDTFLIRIVAWKANHDIGERGWRSDLLDAVIAHLAPLGKVIISTERSLPERFRPFVFRGDPLQMHHLIANCRLYVGESATMASECAILGVPAIYVAQTGRGYTTEQERRYGLVKNIDTMDIRGVEAAIDGMLSVSQETWSQRHRALIDETIDVAPYAVELIQTIGN